MELLIATAAQRPDLVPLLRQFNDWPQFMRQDPVGTLYYDDPVTAYPEFVLIAVEAAHPDRLVAKGFSVPFSWDGDPDECLPEGGWDAVVLAATLDRLAGRRGDLVSALEIAVRNDLRGQGISARMLDALRRNARELGYPALVAPVRPNAKHHHPEMPIAEYAAWCRDDGLPVDPWLRVHLRAGGRIVGVSQYAMTIVGTLAAWREWTGLPFATGGPVHVPEALVPVQCDPANDRAVYCEPCVWVHHRLT